ncbi:Fc receptor-like protein 2 [Engystomops pustulosus]|uniref:Fc receptor-like protein 2 n=1 Tax=Engystomops pustulosus TaxID=76066 RepID=UPI003AFB7AE1
MMQVLSAVNKPNFTLLPSVVAVGGDVVLQCQSSKGSVPIYYRFYHNQTFIGNITTHQKEATELRLSIKSLTMGGLYYCISQNDFHTQQQHSEVVSLLVMEPVEGITITADKEGEDFSPGESLTFTCSIQRGSSISVFWKHNESLVEESSDHYQLQDNGKVLYIDSLQNHHKGTYQCHANNALNRTFSVYSETRNINIVDISAADHSFQWAMLGILLFVLILIIALIFKFRETIVCPGRDHKTPSSTGRETQKDNGDDGQQNNTSGSEGIYQNTVATRRDIDDDVSYAYINIRAPQAASSYPAAARDNDFQVLYSTVKCSDVTPETTTDEKTLEMSTAIYHTITAHDINHRQPNLMEDMKEG